MSEIAMTKEKLVGMQVIDSEAKLVGVVKDVTFTIGKAVGITLKVESKTGDSINVAWDVIQAVGDFIILQKRSPVQAAATAVAAAVTSAATPAATPTAPSAQEQRICATCGGQLTYIPQYQRNYCYKCQKYA